MKTETIPMGRPDNRLKKHIAFWLVVVLFITTYMFSIPASMAQTEQNIFNPKTNGDISTVGNITVTPNITTGDVYMEAKIKPTATTYDINLFRLRHNNNGSYSAYTPTIVLFSGGKVSARNNYGAVTPVKVGGVDYTYSADTWYTVKIKVTMGGTWGPTYNVWLNDGSGEVQVVSGYVVTGGTGFANLGRLDFSAAASTPFEYIKCYRLVDNSVPTVFLTSPVANQTFVSGEDTISLIADAQMDGGTITKVEFYDGTDLLSTDTQSPYQYDWTTASVGNHSLTAKAYADAVSSTSPAVAIKVNAPNARPQVNMITPANNALYAPDSTFDITVSAADSDGTISKVEFYSGTQKLGEKTVAETDGNYKWTLSGAVAGSYVLTAIATDDKGGTGASQSIQIEVGSTDLIQESYYSYNFNDYTAAMGTTAPKKFGAYISGDGQMGAVAAPDMSSWGNCIKLTSSFGAQIGLPTPNPTTGIIIAEGDFRFEGYGIRRSLFHPRYTSSASTIAQVLSTSGNTFVTKGSSFIEAPTGYKFSENQWYHLRSIIDLNNHTYAIEANGQTIVKLSSISYGTAFNAISLFGLGQEAGTGAMYIDNLKISRMAPPTVNVSLTSPYNNQVIQSGTSLELKALATTTPGTIASVEYYNGDELIGSATTAPYSYTWTNIPAGILTITAKAYSSTGETGVSPVAKLNAKTVVIPSIFASSMILQQNTPINVWGTGIDGATVTVVFNQTSKSCTVVDGNWNVQFDGLSADSQTEYDMLITDTLGFEQQLSHIMMGEVWICSGQSNMERALYSDGEYATESASANYPNIRLFFQDANPQSQPQVDVKNGQWKVCSPTTVGSFSAVGYYFGKEIHLSQNVPVGLISATVGGTQVASWVSEEALTANSSLNSYKSSTASQTGNRLQYGLYNGMISPLMPFGIQGVVWYQGESDAYAGSYYDELLKTLITSWRNEWNDQNIDFEVIQLPNYNDPNTGNKWNLVRQGQYQTSQTLNKVGLAVTIDLGDSNDVHPLYKRQVGYRAALSARKLTYNENIDLYQGPICKNIVMSGNKLIVDFDFKGAGLKTSDYAAPRTFEIRGADGIYYPATATIQANTVELTSASVPTPVAARYAQSNDPDVNLYNSADLPAMPFVEVLATEATTTPPAVTANDITNTIVGLNLSTMEYAISIDGGITYGAYTSDASPALGGSRMVKVRTKAIDQTTASTDTILTFTPNAGDVSGDGVIDISDVIMAAEIAVGNTNYTTAQISRANVSDKNNSTVDISDVVMIAERAVGGTISFPVDL